MLLVLLLLGVRFLLPTVYAAPPLVTDPTDNAVANGLCSLREAILVANGSGAFPECGAAGDNTITFDPGVNLIVINSGAPLPPITADGVTIDGGNTVTLRGDRTTTATAGSGLTITSRDNVISGLTIVEFPEHGILITGPNARANQIHSNLIGIVAGDPDPGLVNSNGLNGIMIDQGARGNIIGPTGAGATQNVISQNLVNGIQIEGLNSGDPTTETRGNRIVGNWIGLSEDGLFERPNNENGILVTQGAANNIIGGSNAEGNIVSGNTQNGIFISTNATNTTVSFNTIGLNPNGTIPIGNEDGLVIANAATLTNATNNLIAENRANGVEIRETGTTNNVLTNNTIRNNDGDGVLITNQANGNTIGPNNVIRNNTLNGVQIDGFGTGNNLVQRNNIRNNTLAGIGIGLNNLDGTGNNRLTENSTAGNGGLGIDLGLDGITPNDGGDGDNGPNLLMNFPVLQFAVNNGVELVVVGTMPGQAAEAPFRIEFFRPDVNFGGVAGASGEGQTFLGTSTVGASAGAIVLGRLATGATADLVTATATSTQNNTSEFSVNIPVEQLRANFTAVPTTGVAPLLVQFDSSASIGNIGGRTWNFGDGSPVVNNVIAPTHTYNATGTYTVTLTLTHVSGLVTATATQQIVVQPAVPPTDPPTFTPSITATATITLTPSRTNTITATASATQTPSLTITPSHTATFTFTPSLTATQTPSLTLTPSLTITPSLTLTHTFTPIPTDTPTPRPTSTPIPSNTPTPIPTNTTPPTFTPPPTATNTPTNTPAPGIGITKVPIDDDTVEIIVVNEGGTGDVTVQEQLRPGVVYVAARPSEPECREEQGIVTCSLGTLPNGEEANIQIDVNTDGVDVTSGFTRVTIGGRVVTLEEPYIVKVSQPPFASPGSPITYVIRIINPTTRAFSGITMRDQMPAGVQIDSAEASSGSVSVSGQNITFTQASLAPGDRITITIRGLLLEVEGDAAQQLINRACMTTASNSTPRCAVSGFIRASQLPGTGESPVALHWLIVFSGVVGLSTLILLRRLLRRAT